jgi:hypothetical protein
MDKTFKYLLIAAAGYLAFKIYSLYTELQLTFLSFTLGGSLLNPTVQVLFNVNNPTTSDFLINSVSGNLSSAGQNLGTVNISQPIVVPAGSSATIPVNIVSGLGNLISVVQDYLSGNKTNIVHYSGTVTVNSLPIPISKDL